MLIPLRLPSSTRECPHAVSLRIGKMWTRDVQGIQESTDGYIMKEQPTAGNPDVREEEPIGPHAALNVSISDFENIKCTPVSEQQTFESEKLCCFLKSLF